MKKVGCIASKQVYIWQNSKNKASKTGIRFTKVRSWKNNKRRKETMKNKKNKNNKKLNR